MNKRGFTLIEIMIVIVLIGILAGIALFRYSKATSQAKMREAVLVLKRMWEMEYMYYMSNGMAITHDGIPVYYAVNAGNSELNELNSKKLYNMGFDPKSGSNNRFYYVNTEGAITFAFPKTSSSPFGFPSDEIDGALKGLELAIDNDGKIYVYENGKVWEFE